jgi:hypothetical protein
MLIFLVLHCIFAALQIQAAAPSPASWEVTNLNLTLFNANSPNSSMSGSVLLSIAIFEPQDRLTTRCYYGEPLPVSPDAWVMCQFGEFFARLRGLNSTAEVDFNLDLVKMPARMTKYVD